MFKPENARQYEVKIPQVTKVVAVMPVDLLCHFILHAQGIMAKQVFYFYKIHKILKQALFKGKLYLFQDIVLITGKKLSKHSIEGFRKNSDKDRFGKYSSIVNDNSQLH